MLKKGAKIREIAEEIGVSERTIYREKRHGKRTFKQRPDNKRRI